MTMQVGAFELREPVPALRRPRLLASLRPWIDVGSVGTMGLNFLEELWGAQPLGQLSNPGIFYDFTRYRPTIRISEGQREMKLPNTIMGYAQGNEGQDWLFLHMLEPHSHGEEYVKSVLEVMKYFDVCQYCLVGSMYAPVPHTRPPLISGIASTGPLQERLRQLGVSEITYEGPTSVVSMLNTEAGQQGIEDLIVVLHLPAYAQLEQDYRGINALLEFLCGLYALSLDTGTVRQEMARQSAALGESLQQDPRMTNWIRELERLYDSEEARRTEEEAPKLSPELEQFLQEIERRWNEPEPR